MNRPHPTRPPLPFLLPSLCLATLPCGDTTRDAEAAADVMLTATTEHRYTVGALVGEDWETFGRVVSVHFDDDGKLHAFDAGAHRMVVGDPEGEFEKSVLAEINRGVPGERMHPRTDGRLVTMDGPKIRMYAPSAWPCPTTVLPTRPDRPGRALPGVNTVSDFSAAFNVRGGARRTRT